MFYNNLCMKREEPGPGQESVWDYPRPPRLEKSDKQVKVVFNGETIAETHNAKRVLETSHPPVYYIPPEDVKMKFLEQEPGSSYCEWKGQAHYYRLTVGDRTGTKAAWSYASPNSKFKAIKDHIAFYPHKMDACYIDDEQVKSQ